LRIVATRNPVARYLALPASFSGRRHRKASARRAQFNRRRIK
jgi:hypothetical protein